LPRNVVTLGKQRGAEGFHELVGSSGTGVKKEAGEVERRDSVVQLGKAVRGQEAATVSPGLEPGQGVLTEGEQPHSALEHRGPPVVNPLIGHRVGIARQHQRRLPGQARVRKQRAAPGHNVIESHPYCGQGITDEALHRVVLLGSQRQPQRWLDLGEILEASDPRVGSHGDAELVVGRDGRDGRQGTAVESSVVQACTCRRRRINDRDVDATLDDIRDRLRRVAPKQTEAEVVLALSAQLHHDLPFGPVRLADKVGGDLQHDSRADNWCAVTLRGVWFRFHGTGLFHSSYSSPANRLATETIFDSKICCWHDEE
jgi:hypothetical protein